LTFNSKKKIALFGTSADPPTLGHKKILEELSKIFSFTVTYASNNPQKKHIEDLTVRSLLLKTLVKDLANHKIIFNQKLSSQWAIESILKCKKTYKFQNLYFVIGSDLIENIFHWKHFEAIIKEVSFFIIEREGYSIESNTLKMLINNHVQFETSTLNIPNISSSMIRLNTNYSHLPKSLIDIVKKNNLYTSTK